MRRIIIGLIIIVAAVTGYVLSYPVFDSAESERSREDVSGETHETNPVSAPLVAVSFDNDPMARPAYGLSAADIVFETVIEGGVTRILGVFSVDGGQGISKIGPVRSARPYFVDWARGWGAAFAHSGGSREALAQIEELGSAFSDINEFSAEHYFWRDSRKPAPHNLFTSSKLLNDYFEKKGWDSTSSPNIFPERSASEVEGVPVSEILVNFSYPQFAAKFAYDETTKSYWRFLGGKADKDAGNGEQIKAKNVVVLYTTSSVIDEQLLTINLITSGSGKALIFRDGQMLAARWKKGGSADALKLLDADNSIIKLNPGPTWIEVIDQHGRASWK